MNGLKFLALLSGTAIAFAKNNDDGFDPNDIDNLLSVMLGCDDKGDVQHFEASHKQHGDLTAQLFETDAWKECATKTGMNPLEYLAAAMTEAINNGQDDVADIVDELGPEEERRQRDAGVDNETIAEEILNGQSEGEDNVALT